MADATDTAAALGSAYTMVWDGHEYKLGPLTEGVIADYTAWLKSKALSDCFALKPHMPDKEWQAYYAAVKADMNSLYFDWMGHVSLQSVAGIPGMAKLAQLCIRGEDGPEHPTRELEMLALAKHDEFKGFIDRLMEEAAPKSRAAALKRIK